MVPLVRVQSTGRESIWLVSEDPHLGTVFQKIRFNGCGKVMASVNHHPNLGGWEPAFGVIMYAAVHKGNHSHHIRAPIAAPWRNEAFPAVVRSCRVTKPDDVPADALLGSIVLMVISRVPSCRPRLMEVWAVIYDPGLFPDDLYERALQLVDPESFARIKRFYRREDACRTLIGRLLTRTLLKQRGIPVSLMSFGATEAKKPYIATPGLDPPIAYNISHDNGLVVMAFAPGTHNPPAFSIGIDVMKVRIPGRDTVASFVNSVGYQLTPLEYRSLFAGISQDETLRRFFWIWTMKEAYTKALGLGLGFDFRRVEYDIEANVVRVDNQVPAGWRFSKFVVNIEEDVYEGVVAEYLGGLETEIVHESAAGDWSITYDAVEFVEKAIHDLRQE